MSSTITEAPPAGRRGGSAGPGGGRFRGSTVVCLVGLVVAGAIGLWARVRGLGLSPLANDEYYFVLSIERILAHGVPVFETGGIYTRGILIQYLTVPAMALASTAELGARIPSVVFGLATAGLGWLYGRRTLGPAYACVLAALILLSSWEVEFSRFARMYIGFQLATLAMLIALHDALGAGGRSPRVYLVPALAFVAQLTHALAILLVPLIFLPLILPGARARLGDRGRLVRYGLACVGVAAFAWVLRTIRFRGAGVTDPFPVDFLPAAGEQLIPLAFPFWRVSADPYVNLAVVLLVLAATAAFTIALVRAGKADRRVVFAASMAAAAAMHQLLIALILGLVLALRFGPSWSVRRDRLATVLATIGVLLAVCWAAFAAWLTYGAGSRGWIEQTGHTLFSDAAAAAFIWPNPWGTVLGPWLAELPVLAWFIGLALLAQIVLKARRPVAELVRNPAFVVLYILAVMGSLQASFEVTRYTFFVYPVALALLILSVKDVSHLVTRFFGGRRSGVALGVPASLVMFAVSGDFNPEHLIHVDSPAALYRTGQFEELEDTWYARDDFATPAQFVDRVSPGDSVIVHEAPAVSYYLKRPHAVYLERWEHRFANVSRNRGTVDFWSGQRLLSTPSEVEAYTRCAARVWIVFMTRGTRWIDYEEVWGEQVRTAERAFVSPDGALEVVRIDLRRAPCAEAEAA